MARNLEWNNSATDNSFMTAGNWNDLATGVAALTSPEDGDSCYINRGSINITADLSNTGIDLVTLAIGPGFSGSIGTAGTSLTIAVTTQFTYAGRCQVCNIAAGTNGIALASVGGSGTVGFTGGTTTLVVVGQSGNVYIGASATVTNLDNSGSVTAAAGTAFTLVKQGAGSLTSARNLGTATIMGGVVQATGLATLTSGSIGGGGRLNWNSTGTITFAEVFANGSTDAKGAIVGFTVTNQTAHPGAITAFDFETVNITRSNAIKDYRKLI